MTPAPKTPTRLIRTTIVSPIPVLALLLKSGVIAREQRDRSNPSVLRAKYGGIAALPLVARNDKVLGRVFLADSHGQGRAAGA